MAKYPFSPELLDALPEELAEIFRALEATLLSEICARLNVGDQLNEITVQDIKTLRSHGIDLDEITKAIKKATGLSDKKLEELLEDVVKRNQRYYDELITIADVTKPETLVSAADINAIKTQCQRDFANITGSLGFLVDGGRTMLAPAKAYQWALDRAVLQVDSGAVSYRDAIKAAVTELANSGIKTVSYESGHVDQIDVSVRRAVMTGVNQLCAKYTEQSAEWLETPYYEVSAHIGARDKEGPSPWSSHKNWQGRVYSVRAGDIYPSIYEVCGLGAVDGLEGANCRHKRSVWVEGVSERTYTDEQLAHIDDGHDCTYDGKHYTAYEATQMQRRIERTIRKQKRLKTAYQSAGLTEDAQTANIKLRRLNTKYREFSKAAGLPEQRERMKVTYAEKLKAQRAAEAVKRTSPRETSPTPRYVDVTAQWRETATPNSHIVQDAQEYTKGGVTYKVDGHNVALDYSPHEKEIAELLEREFGGELYMVPRINNPQGVSTPDYIFRGEKYDLKDISGNGKNTIYSAVSKKREQANNFISDVSNSKMDEADVELQIKGLFESMHTRFINTVILVRNGKIVKVFKRNK